MRLLAAILVVPATFLIEPAGGEAQTPPNGYWQGWASTSSCPNVQGSAAISECASPAVACESYAAFRGGALSSMTPRYYANGELIGFVCGIAGGSTDSENADLTCPNSSIGYTRTHAGCIPEIELDAQAFEPPPPPCGGGNRATGGQTFGNPTIAANGARLERVTDIAIGGEPALTFARYYYGQAVGIGLMGVGWASDLDRALGLSAAGANPSSVTAQRPTGRRIAFARKGSSPNYTYGGDDDTEERLTQTATG